MGKKPISVDVAVSPSPLYPASAGAAPPAVSNTWLTQCIPGWERRAGRAPHVLGVLVGEGIGPEVVDAALVVLDAVANGCDLYLELRRGGAIAADTMRRLSARAAEFCQSVFAAGGTLLCGPAGGRSVYDLRQRFDLYCKIMPIRPLPALADAAIVSPNRLTGVDMLIVRENVGGLYFGDYGRREGGSVAYQHLSYTADQIVRITDVAARLASMRRGRLSVVVKAGGIPEVSALWNERAGAVAADRGVEMEMLDIDNASFQMVADPRRFDVVVAPNLFGDILGDVAAALLGSRGMSYSANFGPDGRAVYQTGHGAAYDLTGSGRANPTAQILSLALLLRESFGRADAAWCIERAVEKVLAEGFRTPDIAAAGSRIVGTRELAERIAREAADLAGEQRKIA